MLFENAWNALVTINILLLVVNSCLVSRRFVPEMTMRRLGLIGLAGYGMSQLWISFMSGAGEWIQLIDPQACLMAIILSLLLLLFDSLKTVDRRIET